ncbi:MAG: methyltransferase [Eubacteriales bacterium]|nr:methyltransferase [Eubacteriales bacterium]MDQ7790258.1 methyltransferase [Clostridia bacterium]MDZ4042304.1 methyltransferase [Eubacteriales bacterium]MDZ7609850.1 methyltransferase [Eubacteriales bacterium]
MPDSQALSFPEELLVVGGAVSLGLFDLLAQREYTFAELAEELKADRRALDALVFALDGYGYLEYSEKISLTESARELFFDTESDRYTGFAFMHVYNRIPYWLELPDTVRSGLPPARPKGPDRLKIFMNAMRYNARGVDQTVAEACLAGLEPPVRLLDLGGGPLNYAIPFAEQGALVTVLDTPAVVELMRPQVPEGLEIDLVPGDFIAELPAGPFDVIYLGNISHIYGPDDNLALFQRCRRSLRPGGRLAIFDFVRGMSSRAPFMAINMLMSTAEGGVWTSGQYSQWLDEAGFEGQQMHHIQERQLIIAHKKPLSTG